MVTVMLENGVRVKVEMCDSDPLFAEAHRDRHMEWVVDCGCCKGSGEHPHGEGPDRTIYFCEYCEGKGGWTLEAGMRP